MPLHRGKVVLISPILSYSATKVARYIISKTTKTYPIMSKKSQMKSMPMWKKQQRSKPCRWCGRISTRHITRPATSQIAISEKNVNPYVWQKIQIYTLQCYLSLKRSTKAGMFLRPSSFMLPLLTSVDVVGRLGPSSWFSSCGKFCCSSYVHLTKSTNMYVIPVSIKIPSQS